MKLLTLNPPLSNKLQKLTKQPDKLHYLGTDPNDLLTRPCVAVVGSRKPTPYGVHCTETIVRELSRAGVVIISGLAFGIDSIAHKTALQENGLTIAVLPSGLTRIYPATHEHIAQDIVRHSGALISEYEADHQPRNIEFLERNRLIAAFSDFVLIPEAAERSGSLNTASHAKKLHIALGALPGPVTSPMSAGTNKLIKSGAHLIQNAQDVLRFLSKTEKLPATKLYSGANELESQVLQTIRSSVADTTALQLATTIELPELQITLTMLEINGHIKQDPSTGVWTSL